jgi:hypothetical protein
MTSTWFPNYAHYSCLWVPRHTTALSTASGRAVSM